MADLKLRCLSCCAGTLALGILIIFIMCMAAYKHLGPDDQILLKSPTGLYVKNGPWGGQLHITHGKEWRKATLLDPLEYAIVQDTMTAEMRRVMGPRLLFLEAYEKVLHVYQKIVLEKHEYVRLTEKQTGVERIVTGPGTIVPEATESWRAVESAVFVNVGTAVVVRNRITGRQTLVTSCTHPSGVWFPDAAEEVVDIRELIYVLPHEAVMVRDVDGNMTVYSGREAISQGCSGQVVNTGIGGISFFLPPYSKIVRMQWSTHEHPSTETRRLATKRRPSKADPRVPKHSSRISREEMYVWTKEGRRLESIYVDQESSTTSTGPKRTVVAIDMRTHKSYYKYQVRTSDNVQLELEGTVFWQLMDVRAMLAMTSDPEGDVWSKCRSNLIAAISAVTLGDFMSKFNDVVMETFDEFQNSTFFSDRGIKLVSMELTNYKPTDEQTANTLQSIIRATVLRINDLQKQRSENDVRKEKLDADIKLELNTTDLLNQQATNARIVAETAGATEGGKNAQSIASFLSMLNSTLENTTDSLDLFRQNALLKSAKKDAEQLTAGDAVLYMAPQAMDLRLQMAAHSHEL